MLNENWVKQKIEYLSSKIKSLEKGGGGGEPVAEVLLATKTSLASGDAITLSDSIKNYKSIRIAIVTYYSTYEYKKSEVIYHDVEDIGNKYKTYIFDLRQSSSNYLNITLYFNTEDEIKIYGLAKTSSLYIREVKIYGNK